MPEIEDWVWGVIIGGIALVIGGLVFQFGDKIHPPDNFSPYGWIGIGVGLLIIFLTGREKFKHG